MTQTWADKWFDKLLLVVIGGAIIVHNTFLPQWTLDVVVESMIATFVVTLLLYAATGRILQRYVISIFGLSFTVFAIARSVLKLALF